IERIMRWLPAPFQADDVYAQLLNQAIRPTVTPTRWHDLTALNAAGREILKHTIEVWRGDTRPLNPIFANGHRPKHSNMNLEESELVLLTGAPLARGSKPTAL